MLGRVIEIDIPELHGKHGTGCFSALRKEFGDLIF
jgi:hypothetical protein